MARRNSTKRDVVVDMTAMTDVSFLLLTFFILTANFRPTETVMIDTPASRAEKRVPEDLITITVDEEGTAYFGLSRPIRRVKTLESLIERYSGKYPALKELSDNPVLIEKFGAVETYGYDINYLPTLLKMKSTDFNKDKHMPGVPMDSTNNQLGDWINAARATGLEESIEVPIAIKGDRQTNVVAVKEVIETLRKREIYRFNLITSLGGRID